jgi:hypothetical protein
MIAGGTHVISDNAEVITSQTIVPIGESVLVWAGACALATKRHPHAPTPELADVEDARTVLLGAVSIDRNESQTHG